MTTRDHSKFKIQNLKLFALIFPIWFTSYAQQPVPAAPQSKPVLLTGGTIHVGNGQVIENGAVVFENGKITTVGKATDTKSDATKYTVIDVTGKHVYPGFIAPNTLLGLTEIESVKATRDNTETGELNPNLRSVISYNTDSKVPPTVRTNGVLLAQSTPQGGTISGQSSIFELDGWNWEDAVYKSDIGIHLNWPRMFVNRGWWAEPQSDERQDNVSKEIRNIYSLFSDAKAYASAPATIEKNLKLEAMRGLFDGSKKLFIHANYVKEIMAAAGLARQFGCKMVLVGGRDSWMVTDLLKENNIPVILPATHSLPSREDEDTDLPYKLPYLLQKAGVLFCLSEEGFWQQRNLPFMAGTAAAYGLTKEQAIMAITSSSAKILGIDPTSGTLEIGKDATIFVSTGDALDMKSNNAEYAFIRGKQLDLKNIQSALYLKYKTKYGLK